MILREIRAYLRRRGSASLADIALHFDSEPEALRGMLELWMRKGKVRRQMATASCGSSCNRCQTIEMEIYSWADPPSDSASVLSSRCSRA